MEQLLSLSSQNPDDLGNSHIRSALKKLRDNHRDDSTKQLGHARVLGVTAAAACFSALENKQFAICIMDEASQMTEPLSLLAMGKFRVERLLCCGDPQQLPPTLTSPCISKGNINTKDYQDPVLLKPLFTRLTEIGFKAIVLRTQYRCHPVLSKLANKLFYDNQLLDGVSISERKSLVGSWSPFSFCSIDGPHTSANTSSGSIYNDMEVSAVVQLVSIALENGLEASQIGVISLYLAQVSRIRAVLDQRCPGIHISTVDAFQGVEKDIIFLSCARSKSGSGFLDSPHRLNVALTRGKHHLIVIGNAVMLSSLSSRWKAILEYARSAPYGFHNGTEQLLSLAKTFEQAPESDSKDTLGASFQNGSNKISNDSGIIQDDFLKYHNDDSNEESTDPNTLFAAVHQYKSDLHLPNGHSSLEER